MNAAAFANLIQPCSGEGAALVLDLGDEWGGLGCGRSSTQMVATKLGTANLLVKETNRPSLLGLDTWLGKEGPEIKS